MGVTERTASHVLRILPINVTVPAMLTPTVTLLASLDPLLRERAIAAARAGDPELVVVRHELTTLALDGHVHRRVDAADRGEDTALPIEAGCCLSCLLREDTLAVLAGYAGRRVLLVLPPAVEPASVAIALHEHAAAEIAAIATALDLHELESRLQSPDPLASVEDVGDDPRSVAEVLARQLDHSDVVLHSGGDTRAKALASALSGLQAQRLVDDRSWMSVGFHDHGAFIRRLQAGMPACRGGIRSHGVEQRCWHRHRPFHPERLLQLLESDRLATLVRAQGWLWVATRPGTVLELDAVGASFELGAVDAWLDAVTDHSRAHPRRRELAARRWDPYYGDRVQDLTLTVLDGDIGEVMRLLDDCLLTDGELAKGPEVWRSWTDPMSPWLGDEDELLATNTGATDPLAADSPGAAHHGESRRDDPFQINDRARRET